MDAFLRATPIIDWNDAAVLATAGRLRGNSGDDLAVARRCYEWVRDRIRHSTDHRLDVVTCTASEVLRHGSSLCYGKSHLLAALLRANGIRAGFCYQRVSLDDHGATYCLHGLNAVLLPGAGWYRVDPRGNRPGVDAQFVPPAERLAFDAAMPGEALLPEVWADPLPIVIDALRAHTSVAALAANLPDLVPHDAGATHRLD